MNAITALIVAAVMAYGLKKLFSTHTRYVQERNRRRAAEARASIRKRDHARSLERVLAEATGAGEEGTHRERLEAAITAAADELDRLSRVKE